MSLRLYSWLRMFLRLVASVFFRQVEIVGLAFDREIQALRDERAALEDAVVAAVNRFRPADMVLLFPRDPESASQ
jgi:hypothetical protein